MFIIIDVLMLDNRTSMKVITTLDAEAILLSSDITRMLIGRHQWVICSRSSETALIEGAVAANAANPTQHATLCLTGGSIDNY